MTAAPASCPLWLRRGPGRLVGRGDRVSRDRPHVPSGRLGDLSLRRYASWYLLGLPDDAVAFARQLGADECDDRINVTGRAAGGDTIPAPTVPRSYTAAKAGTCW